MQSLSKTKISQAAIESIVNHHFGPQSKLHTLEELKDGYFNTAYQMTLQDGSAYVMKVAPHESVAALRYERGLMKTEAAVMRLVQEQTSVPIPRIAYYDDSHQLIDHVFLIMEYLPGIPLNKLRSQLSSEVQEQIEYDLGAQTRQIHAITGAYFGFPHQVHQFASWKDRFAAMFQNVLQDGKDREIILPLPYEEFEQLFTRFDFALEEITTPQLVHWDLWDGNIFIDETTHQICGLIDFERALWGDPLMECHFANFEEENAHMRGYGHPLLKTESAKIRRMLYNLYLYLIMIIECFYRDYETDDQKIWSTEQLIKEIERANAY